MVTTFLIWNYRVLDEEIESALVKLKEAQDTGEFDPDSDPHLLHQLLSDPTMSLENVAQTAILSLFVAGGETVKIISVLFSKKSIYWIRKRVWINFMINFYTNIHINKQIHYKQRKVESNP